MAGLKVAPGLVLDPEFVTKTCGILAQRRVGKTYTASVIAEELVRIKMPFVALDPTGAWWGLRASADGNGPGLPVVIFGGEHADLPLERTAGKFIADLVVDQPGYYIIDFSLFESSEAERQFATDFGERLYRKKARAEARFPMHLIVDEADRFIPQSVPSGDQRMLGAYEVIVRRGGIRGLGTTLISQRAAVVNKNALEQLDILITLRVVGPNDRKAIDGYIKSHGTDEERQELLGSLASLAKGEGWVWEPGGEPPLFKRVQFRERRTFNSSATPKPGEARIEPRQFAKVEIEALREQMTETIERVKENDPVELRKRLAAADRESVAEIRRLVQQKADLEAKVRYLEMQPVKEVERIVEVKVPVPVLSDEDRMLLTTTQEAMERVRASVLERTHVVPSGNRQEPQRSIPRSPAPLAPVPAAVRFPEPSGAPSDNGSGNLSRAERSILIVLAQYPQGRTKRQVAVVTGYAMKGGGFNNALSALRTKEFISRSEPMKITQAGLDALGTWTPLPQGQELLDHWLSQLGGSRGESAHQKILRTLAKVWPAAMSKEALAEATVYEPGGGGFNNALSKLRTLELIEGKGEIKLADLFFGEEDGS